MSSSSSSSSPSFYVQFGGQKQSSKPEKEAAEMRPGGMSGSTGGAAANLWRSPIPYLFGGMGAMMVLIAVALVVLACSHWKSSRRAAAEAAAEKAVVIPLDMEPRIVVIMAGDDKPTYLAKPFSSSTGPIAHSYERSAMIHHSRAI